MKIFHFILIVFFALSAKLSSQPFYINIGENSGVEYESSLNGLENYSSNLAHALPSTFRNSFKVFSTGFYLHNRNFVGGIPDEFEIAIDTAQNESTYYLLFGREKNTEGKIVRYWVDLKLPFETDSLECFKQNDVYLLKGKIESKLTPYLGNEDKTFSIAENAAISLLKDELEYIVHCCHVVSNNGNCDLEILSKEEILSDLYERGYAGYPITITDVGVQGNYPNRRSSCNIEFYSGAEFNIVGNTQCNLEDNICNFIQTLPNGFTNKVYVTDNNTWPAHRQEILNDFENNHYDVGMHFHLYDSPNDHDDIPDLILYYDYSIADIAWCVTLAGYDPKNYVYPPLNFAGQPLLYDNAVPEKPGKWRKFSLTITNRAYLVDVENFAHENNIPSSDIYIYNIPEEFSWGDLLVELFADYYIPDDAVKFALIYQKEIENDEINELINVFPSTASITDDWIAPYYGWGENGVFHCGPTWGAPWDLFWAQNPDNENEDPEPIINENWVNELKKCNDFIYYAGFNKLKVIKRIPLKAAVKSELGWTVYTFRLAGKVYYGITRQNYMVRIAQHAKRLNVDIKDFEKMEDLISFAGDNKNIARGLEQFFIEYGRKFEDIMNRINSTSPKRVDVFKARIDEAFEFMRDNKKELFEKYKWQELYDLVKQKYGFW
jgi:hypothetical protein